MNQNYLVVLMSSFFFEYLQLLLKPLYGKIKVTDLLLHVLATNEFLFQSSNRAAQGHSFASLVSQGKTNACPFWQAKLHLCVCSLFRFKAILVFLFIVEQSCIEGQHLCAHAVEHMEFWVCQVHIQQLKELVFVNCDSTVMRFKIDILDDCY